MAAAACDEPIGPELRAERLSRVEGCPTLQFHLTSDL